MTALWIVLLVAAGVAGCVDRAVVSRLIGEDAETRLARIPSAILYLAAARLAGELREDLASRAEVHLALHRRQTAHPAVARQPLCRQPADLGAGVADGLGGHARGVPRAAQLIGVTAAVCCAAWVSVLSYDCLNVAPQPAFGVTIYSTSAGGRW